MANIETRLADELDLPVHIIPLIVAIDFIKGGIEAKYYTSSFFYKSAALTLVNFGYVAAASGAVYYFINS